MEDKELREKVSKMLRTKGEAAKEIGMDYVYFTRFMNGSHLGKESKEKVIKWLNKKKKELTV